MFSDNPYESPVIVAELADRPRKKPGPLPVVSIFAALVATFFIGAWLTQIHVIWGLLFPASCLATLVFVVAYDAWRRFR